MNYDTVFHFDNDLVSLNITVTNIVNFDKALSGKDYSLVLVVNGPGIQLMGKDNKDVASKITMLDGLGVTIRVCKNAMTHFKLTPEWLCPECEIVEAGIMEIVELQKNGYAYIKP